MGRPSKFDRDEAVEAAMQAVWTSGYEQASAKALAELLGITRSSFYNAFGSREALFAEIIRRYAKISPDAPLYGEVSGPVLPLLVSVFREICRVRGNDREARGCIIIDAVSEICPSPEAPGPMLESYLLGSARRLEDLLNLAKTRGELPVSADAHALALAMQNLLVGLNVLCKVVRNEEELWLLTKTTMKGLGLLPETTDA